MSCFIQSVRAANDIAHAVRAHRAGFSHHLVGCAAAVTSRDVYGAWGDAKKGDYSCHLSVNPQAGCSLLDYRVALVFGGWERLQQKVATLTAGQQWLSLASPEAAGSGTDRGIQPE